MTVGPAKLAPNGSQFCVAAPCAFSHHDVPVGVEWSAPFNGVATRVRINGLGALRVRVMHFVSGTTYFFKSTGPTLMTAGSNAVQTFPVAIPLQAGDSLGIDVPDGGSWVGTAPAGAGWSSVEWTGPPADGTGGAANGTGTPVLQYNYEVEPDADADGFGDDSQDRCAGSTGSDRGCQPGVLDPKVVQVVQVSGLARVDRDSLRLSKGRRGLRLRVACPAGPTKRCRGTVSAKATTARKAPVALGRVRFNIRAGRAKQLTIALSKRARAAFRKQRRLRLRLTLTESESTRKSLG